MSSEDNKKATAPKASDSTLRGYSGYRMKRAFNVVQSDLARVLKPFGLRMVTYSALAIIADSSGLRQSELARALDMERPNLVAIVDQLERKGWLQRNRVPSDRRAHALVLTDVGADLVRRASEAVAEHDRQAFSGLTDEELQNLHRYLKVVEAKTGRSLT